MTEPAIDRAAFERLVEMTGGEMDFVDELVDTYLEDGAQQIELLREAAAGGEGAEGLVRPAHSLKSSSMNVGALPLGMLCRALEAAARAGEVSHPAEWVERIASGFDDARRELLEERASRASSN